MGRKYNKHIYLCKIESMRAWLILVDVAVSMYALCAAEDQPPCLCISSSEQPPACAAVAADLRRLCSVCSLGSPPAFLIAVAHTVLMCEVGMGRPVCLKSSSGSVCFAPGAAVIAHITASTGQVSGSPVGSNVITLDWSYRCKFFACFTLMFIVWPMDMSARVRWRRGLNAAMVGGATSDCLRIPKYIIRMAVLTICPSCPSGIAAIANLNMLGVWAGS